MGIKELFDCAMAMRGVLDECDPRREVLVDLMEQLLLAAAADHINIDWITGQLKESE